jgi:hypothetical protein
VLTTENQNSKIVDKPNGQLIFGLVIFLYLYISGVDPKFITENQNSKIVDKPNGQLHQTEHSQ